MTSEGARSGERSYYMISLREFTLRLRDYIQWRALNVWERVWKRAHKVAYHHALADLDKERSSINVEIDLATAADLTELPGSHDIDVYQKRLTGAHELLLARDGTNVLGFLWLSFTDIQIKEVGATIDFAGDGYLWHVHVLPDHRGRGIGTQMIRKALLVAADRADCRRVFCLTEWSNLGMRRVIEKAGFEPPEHLSYAKTGPEKSWAVHDSDPGPFVELLETSVNHLSFARGE